MYDVKMISIQWTCTAVLFFHHSDACLFTGKCHITPSPCFSSLSRSSNFEYTASIVFAPFICSTHRGQSQVPKPQASNSVCRAFKLPSGLTYVIRSSSPGSISRFATMVMRESAVRWSKWRTETFGEQEWLRCEWSVYRPPWASRFRLIRPNPLRKPTS